MFAKKRLYQAYFFELYVFTRFWEMLTREHYDQRAGRFFFSRKVYYYYYIIFIILVIF